MTTFGRFQITGELGRGGMGVVFRGWDPDIAREVAIKVLRTDSVLSEAEREEARARFDREAQAAGGLNHPGIVAIYERGEIDGNRFIVMEFVEGRPLSALMTEGPRPGLAESLSILRQTAAALDFAHDRGVIHRDVKPANVLVQRGGAVKIADFGIAKRGVAGGVTASSVIIGSPHYMAPEQIEAKAVDGRTDQWALAVTAWELLTGAKPFQSDSVASLFQQILSGPLPDPWSENPTLPEAARPAFARALSKAPGDRFGSCIEFVEALTAAVLPAAGAPGPAPRRRIVVRIKPAWAVGAMAFLALFMAVLWWGATRLAVTAPRGAPVRGDGTAVPRPGEIRRNARNGLEYVWIAPGKFSMGCSPGQGECPKDEPAHEVSITKGYWIGRTEVTVGAFQRLCRAAGGQLPPAPDFNPDWGNAKLPATAITWNEAARFCRWSGGRLPTEAEWEFAARAGSGAARNGNLDRAAWTSRNSGQRAHEVGTLEANAYGLFDMLGNVWEWTADRYGDAYYLHSPALDPAGPATGHFRVLRGGAWTRDASDVRLTMRYPVPPDDPDHGVGFRCAADEMP